MKRNGKGKLGCKRERGWQEKGYVSSMAIVVQSVINMPGIGLTVFAQLYLPRIYAASPLWGQSSCSGFLSHIHALLHTVPLEQSAVQTKSYDNVV